MANIINKIQEAIITNRKISFSYINNDLIKSNRTIFPYYLTTSYRGTFLKGFCFLRNDERVFNIDKITKLKIEDEVVVNKALIRNKIEYMNEIMFSKMDDYY